MKDNITKLTLSNNKISEEILDHFKSHDKETKKYTLDSKYNYLQIRVKDGGS